VTYNNGVAGVGATLTNAGTQAALVIDGVTVAVNDRVLIYQQANQTQNGIYVVTNVGSVSTNWVLTRSSDANTYVINSANGLSEGSTVFVQQGTIGAGDTYTCNTSGVIVFGTTNITFVQISSAQIYSAGTGLTLTGTQFSLTSPVVTSLGGTGLTSYTTGDMVYYATGSALSKLAIGSSSYVMTSTGSAPQWSDPAGITVGNATNAVNATTATNVAGGAANQLLYQSGAGATTFATSPTLSNTYLYWTGSAFAWGSVTSGSVTSVDVSGGTTGLTTSGGPITSSGTITLDGTGLTTYAVGDLVYASATTTLSRLGVGTVDYLLTSSGTLPQWSAPSSVTVGTATNAVNVATTATATNANFFIPFVPASTTGNQALGVDAGLSYNPSTNAITSGISGGTF
jgi:hypothetical protein